jgi:hypothetical protein
MEGTPHINNEISAGEARAYIMGKLSEMHMTGNMDSEESMIQATLAEMNAGNISPADAQKKIDTMISQRQSYH